MFVTLQPIELAYIYIYIIPKLFTGIEREVRNKKGKIINERQSKSLFNPWPLSKSIY